MKFSDICLITRDVLKLAKFYETIFNVKSEGDAIHSFVNMAGLGLAIYSKNAAETDMGFDFTGSGTGLMTIGFNVDDVDAEYVRITALNICDVTTPHLWPWGAKSFRFKDTDGNIIIIRSMPKPLQ